MNWHNYFTVAAERRPAATAACFLAIYAAIWTVHAVLQSGGVLHGDMTEAYGWGREFQLGYHKHPPFWAWIAGIWFKVFPRENWAFYLLATLNSGAAFTGVWRLTGLFTQGSSRLAATLLLALVPYYTFQSHQFNANFMLVSLWPWTVYFFVRSMDEPGWRPAVWFGVLAAAALLSKYYTGALLATCAAASFAHPHWRRYYASAAPYLSVAVCTLLVAPHGWWLVEHDFITLRYVETRTAFETAVVHQSIVSFIAGCLGFNALVIAVVAAVRMFDRRARRSPPPPPIAAGREWFALILAVGPFLLTVAAGIAGHARLSTNFASPIFFLVPLVLLHWLRPAPDRVVRAAATIAAFLVAGGIAVAPAVPYVSSQKHTSRLPVPELAHEAVRVWHEITELPLRTVAGWYAMDVAFYSGDDTSDFIDFDVRAAPWVQPERIAETGLLAVCLEGEESCPAKAARFSKPGMQERVVTIARHAGGKEPLRFRLLIIPPARTAGGVSNRS